MRVGDRTAAACLADIRRAKAQAAETLAGLQAQELKANEQARESTEVAQADMQTQVRRPYHAMLPA